MLDRKNILYVMLGIVGVAFLLDTGVRKFYDEPHEQREARLNQLQAEITKQEDQLDALRLAPKVLAELNERSLPANLELARANYQNWLLELISQTRLEQPKVDAGQPTARRQGRQVAYYSLGFSVAGRGQLPQILDLLHAFYSANYLHKIRVISLIPIANSEWVDVSLSIETLVLPGASHQEALPQLPAQRLAFDDPLQYRAIARRSLFNSAGAASGQTRWQLSAITFDIRGNGEAWITDTNSGQTQRLKSGDALAFLNSDIQIAEITPSDITIASKRARATIPIGTPLPHPDSLFQPPPSDNH
jgi:hypothetical protein